MDPGLGFPWPKIEASKKLLYSYKPWWSRFLERMPIVPIDVDRPKDSDFGAMTSTDRERRIYIDASFARSAGVEMIAASLERELQRHVRDVWKRFSWLPQDEWDRMVNLCLELEISSSIRAEYSDEYLLRRTTIFTDDMARMWGTEGPPTLGDDGWTPAKVGLPEGLSAEEYYKLLDEDIPNPDEQENEDESESEDQSDDQSDSQDDPEQSDESEDQDPGQSEQSDDSDDSPEDDSDSESDLEGDSEDQQDDSDSPDSEDSEDAESDGGSGDGDASDDRDPGDGTDSEDDTTEGDQSESSSEDGSGDGQESNESTDSPSSDGDEGDSGNDSDDSGSEGDGDGSGESGDQQGTTTPRELANQAMNSSAALSWQASDMGSPKSGEQQSWEPDDQKKPEGISSVDQSKMDMELADDVREMIPLWSKSKMFREIRDWADDKVKTKQDHWEKLFQRIVSSGMNSARISGASDLSYSVRNPNQPSVGPVLMGLHDYSPTIYTIQDVSGSMLMSKALQRSASAFEHMSTAIMGKYGDRATWITVDTEVRDVGKSTKIDNHTMTRWGHGFGGTDLGAVMTEIESGKFSFKGRRYPRPDMLVVNTDCGFPWPWKELNKPPRGLKLLVVSTVPYERAKIYGLPSWIREGHEFIEIRDV